MSRLVAVSRCTLKQVSSTSGAFDCNVKWEGCGFKGRVYEIISLKKMGKKKKKDVVTVLRFLLVY